MTPNVDTIYSQVWYDLSEEPMVYELPELEGTIAAHKSGLSGRNEAGVMIADNDIAIVQLPDGRYYSLAVFVSDSREDDETNVGIITDISKVVYDYLTK